MGVLQVGISILGLFCSGGFGFGDFSDFAKLKD